MSEVEHKNDNIIQDASQSSPNLAESNAETPVLETLLVKDNTEKDMNQGEIESPPQKLNVSGENLEMASDVPQESAEETVLEKNLQTSTEKDLSEQNTVPEDYSPCNTVETSHTTALAEMDITKIIESKNVSERIESSENLEITPNELNVVETGTTTTDETQVQNDSASKEEEKYQSMESQKPEEKLLLSESAERFTEEDISKVETDEKNNEISDEKNNETSTSENDNQISPLTTSDMENASALATLSTNLENKQNEGDVTESLSESAKSVDLNATDSAEKESKKSTEVKENVPIETSSIENDDVVKDATEQEKPSNEPIEPMDTCDSQESINLIIDETSNITENKDDHSDVNKTDEDTNMAVDQTEVNTDNQGENKNKCSEKKEEEKSDDNDNKKNQENLSSTIEKHEETDVHNKSKDDDVITIEQPPVPIIEIDDEDDAAADATDKTDKKKKDVKDLETPMESDENVEEVSVAKEENNSSEKKTEEKEITNSSEYETKEQAEENLLEIASEKPLEEALKMEEKVLPDDDLEEDTTDEVFYHKECINYECPHKHKQYFKVPQFAFSYFKVTKKKFKVQYICADCYDKALDMYEDFCGLLDAKQPLLMENIPSGRQEFVEIIDSSDDEEISDKAVQPEQTKTDFSKYDLSLIEMELHNTIKVVLNRVEIQNQLTWCKTILTERLKRLEMETEYVDSELKVLQKKADKMHEGLYSCPKIQIRQLQPLDLNSGKLMSFDSSIQKEIQPIPPAPSGEIERPPIQLNSTYYSVKNNPIASWVPCRVIEQVEGNLVGQKNVKNYKIKFIKNQIQTTKTVPAKYLAYYDPPTVRLHIGTRVIAYFDATSLARGREKISVQSAFYPGIIAEPLKPNNKFRYLIFYDDGYTQYVYHKDVRLVCHVSDCVWEDVHPASRDFIQKYLTQYSINRPMVQTQKGQSMNTESNGYWLHARVVDIDCSLVLMQFEGSKSHTEWIYRGSLRLGPVFKEYQKSLQKNSSMPVSRLPRRTEPFIRYTEDEETSSQQQQQADKANENNRAVARKTFGRPDSMMNSAQSSQQQQQQQQQPVVKHLNNSTIYVEDENKPKGKVVYYTAKRNLPPRKYKHHICSPSCLIEITHNLSAYSPLSKPLLSGWERLIIRQKIKKVVTYRAPCGKSLRHMKELHHYLRVTENVLNVDNFDFSHETNCLAEYVIESAIVQKRDISGGQEKMAIPLVNYYDNTLPPECKYSAKVIPTEGVDINTDPEFLVGCDCDDDCVDKIKCACWQLTLAGAKYGNPLAAPEEVGYQYRRLLDPVPTGIYECNANCKCKRSCLNRVVQNSLTMKLQVFKTSNRGWGLRCINDIPRGSFVCVYAGHLLTEAKANEGGQDAGDEYFAELDYIEVAEQIKEGYESEVDQLELEEEEPYNPEMYDDEEFTPSKTFLTRSRQKQNATKSTRSGNQEEDSQERQVINFNPNADMNEDSVRENSIRTLYGKDEACYVMDAKISGNLGRYFNHSCAPNMFVQNVFVDTHDLRFPHVAFFSSCNIRAGTELTWNYNYEVGVVPGKVLYCQCGAANCRLRLL